MKKGETSYTERDSLYFQNYIDCIIIVRRLNVERR